MEDIVALCSRVMVLGHGRKLFDGTLPALLGRYDTVRTVTVRYEEPETLPEAAQVSREGETLKITYSTDKMEIGTLLPLLQQAGEIREMTVQPQNIDHLIAAMYQEMGL